MRKIFSISISILFHFLIIHSQDTTNYNDDVLDNIRYRIYFPIKSQENEISKFISSYDVQLNLRLHPKIIFNEVQIIQFDKLIDSAKIIENSEIIYTIK